jgi:hypothetical protein
LAALDKYGERTSGLGRTTAKGMASYETKDCKPNETLDTVEFEWVDGVKRQIYVGSQIRGEVFAARKQDGGLLAVSKDFPPRMVLIFLDQEGQEISRIEDCGYVNDVFISGSDRVVCYTDCYSDANRGAPTRAAFKCISIKEPKCTEVVPVPGGARNIKIGEPEGTVYILSAEAGIPFRFMMSVGIKAIEAR